MIVYTFKTHATPSLTRVLLLNAAMSTWNCPATKKTAYEVKLTGAELESWLRSLPAAGF